MRTKLYAKELKASDGTILKPGDKVVVTYLSHEQEICTVRKSTFENPNHLFLQDNEAWQIDLNSVKKLVLI